MLYHILCIADKTIIVKDQTELNINKIVSDLKRNNQIILDGYIVIKEEIKRIKIVRSEFHYDFIWNDVFNRYQKDGILNYPSEAMVFDSNEVIDVTDNFLI